jgi:hypothetical protein
MDKVEWPEHQLDYSDKFTIEVTKVNFDKEFTHWEAMLHSSDGELHCEVTAPTMGGVLDEVMDYLYDRRYELISRIPKPWGKYISCQYDKDLQ